MEFKRVAKTTAGGALKVAGFGAAMFKHGLKATDSIMGGMVNGMANSFAGSSMGTPIKDMAMKGTNATLGWVEKQLKEAGKDLLN